ncbi:MAG TPA: hypothetical protein PK244_06620 [Pseudomonadales bacterium]|nr:hypothetical protein [Pseudomonadales bacterium]
MSELLYAKEITMDIRDEIAAKVLPAIYELFWKDVCSGRPLDEHWREGVALDAYMMADAMLAMRSAKVGV